MRLFLLPISTRRTLLYCQKVGEHPGTQPTGASNWLNTKATDLWLRWEQKDRGWQRRVVDLGNRALKRIPYEEWGLKSVPLLSRRRREALESLPAKELEVELAYPESLMSETRALEVLRTLGTERRDLHRTRLIYSILGMPLTAPFGLIPIVPNIPFFYVAYRAWSHWRAFSGGKHVQSLLDRSLIVPRPNSMLTQLYAASPKIDLDGLEKKEEMILDDATGKAIARDLDIPELAVEVDRAIAQVREAREKAETPTKES